MSTHSVAIPSLVLNPIVSSNKSIGIIPQNNSVEHKEKKTALQICVVGLGAQNTQDHLPALMASINVEICAVVDLCKLLRADMKLLSRYLGNFKGAN